MSISKDIINPKYKGKKMDNLAYKFKLWYMRNSREITWFLIGWLVTSGVRDLMMGNFLGAAMAFLFAFINYAFSK